MDDMTIGAGETPFGNPEHGEAFSSRHHQVAILDAGSQYGGLIDRNVRELGIRSYILPLDTPPEELANYDAVIISGGPDSVYDVDSAQCDPGIFETGKPILGICYGMQLMTKHFGGTVEKTERREDGPQEASLESLTPIFSGIFSNQQVLMSHGDSVTSPPPGFDVCAKSDELIAAISDEERKLYGLQFHPEVEHTAAGEKIFANFLFGVADLEPDYTLEDQEQEAINNIQEVVGKRDVMLFLSGGVDSTVLAALMARAIDSKERIHAFHIDTGFMRAGESALVLETLQSAGIDVRVIDASERFFSATTIIDGQETLPLSAVIDPQTKRKIIGDTFVRIREQILSEYGLDENTVLAQGSLRPDLIESGSHLASSKADTIKTHHNDTEEVRKLRELNRVVEPLQALYKDQVRAIGRKLGLPKELVDRQPFPGPGLAIRIICAETAYRTENHEEVQQNLDELLLTLAGEDVQAHLLPVQTVGVQGDHRSYKYLAALTGQRKWPELAKLANQIPQHNHEVNRVAYVFGDIDRSTLDITPTKLLPDVVEQLRHADAIVTQTLERFNLVTKLSQVPVVSFPVNFGRPGMRSIAIRPFLTRDFMTGTAALPGRDVPEEFFMEAVGRILTEVPGISRVAYDLTSKPPGTTEWE